MGSCHSTAVKQDLETLWESVKIEAIKMEPAAEALVLALGKACLQRYIASLPVGSALPAAFQLATQVLSAVRGQETK